MPEITVRASFRALERFALPDVSNNNKRSHGDSGSARAGDVFGIVTAKNRSLSVGSRYVRIVGSRFAGAW